MESPVTIGIFDIQFAHIGKGKIPIMKRMMTRFLILGLAGMVLFGCKKEGFTKFNLDYESTVVIQSGIGVSIPFTVNTPSIATNSESELEVNDTRKEKVQHITLTSLSLEITSPSGQEFDFLEDIELYISADGVDEEILAYVYNMENIVGSAISLTCLQNDFQEHIKKDKFTLRVRTVSDEFNLHDVEIKIKSTFLVDAKLIGKA